jgi:hypothetical protein
MVTTCSVSTKLATAPCSSGGAGHSTAATSGSVSVDTAQQALQPGAGSHVHMHSHLMTNMAQ